MEQENRPFVHDTINLEEIKNMLAEEPAGKDENPPAEPPKKPEETEKPKSEEPKGLAYEIYEILHDLVYVVAAVMILFVFVVRLVRVDGRSMIPTLHNNDYVMLESNFLYHDNDIENGDIVVLKVPYYEDAPIVKRVIATEGQTVDIDFEQSAVYVDDVRLEEDYINEPIRDIWGSSVDAVRFPVTVPEGCIFVMGDNRNDSTDSRFAPVGMIDVRCVLGKVRLICLPGQTRDAAGQIVDERDWSRLGSVS